MLLRVFISELLSMMCFFSSVKAITAGTSSESRANATAVLDSRFLGYSDDVRNAIAEGFEIHLDDPTVREVVAMLFTRAPFSAHEGLFFIDEQGSIMASSNMTFDAEVVPESSPLDTIVEAIVNGTVDSTPVETITDDLLSYIESVIAEYPQIANLEKQSYYNPINYISGVNLRPCKN